MNDKQLDPALLQKAVDDRDARPWRYYRFEREDLMNGLDARVEEIVALRAQLQASEAEKRHCAHCHADSDAVNYCTTCWQDVRRQYDEQLQASEAERVKATEGAQVALRARDYYDEERRESYQEMCGWKGRAEHAEAALKASEHQVLMLQRELANKQCVQCAGRIDPVKLRCLECDESDTARDRENEELTAKLKASEEALTQEEVIAAINNASVNGFKIDMMLKSDIIDFVNYTYQQKARGTPTDGRDG